MVFLSGEKLTELAQGTEIELPGFAAEETISVRLRRPSLMLLAAEGKIPNTLLASVEDLFEKGDKNTVSFKERAEIFRIVAMASLVSPSWEELQNSGVNLTDLQLLYIYNFSDTCFGHTFRKSPSIGYNDRNSTQYCLRESIGKGFRPDRKNANNINMVKSQ